MADLPDCLTLKHNRDAAGRREVVVRRAVLAVLTLVLVAGLLNAFAQRPATATASAADARLDLYTSPRVRGGLYVQARFHIHARTDLENATLVLDPGWAEGMTINTIEPSPVGEASRDGKLSLELGHIPAGTSYLLFMQLQVNPTNVGRRSQDVALYDGDRFITRIDRKVTVFP